jgi:hypothetical protein
MARFGKKLLSAFVEVGDEKKEMKSSQNANSAPRYDQPVRAGGEGRDEGATRGEGAARGDGAVHNEGATRGEGAAQADDRFAGHFDKLLSEANIPGPDYYEFARMIGVMRAIPDDAARFSAAFAGLQAQGLDKQRLLKTAGEYLRVLATDADQFQKTVDSALREKVSGKEAEAEEKAGRIRALSQETLQLQQEISALQEEVRANKERLTGGSASYSAESKRRQQEIQRDIEKINQYIH